MATYGEGDPTDNAQAFYEWLQSGEADLSGVNFTVCIHFRRNLPHPYLNDLLVKQVFGLGNKTYEHFNAMGKYVDKRMEELGATRVVEAGVGDDDGK